MPHLPVPHSVWEFGTRLTGDDMDSALGVATAMGMLRASFVALGAERGDRGRADALVALCTLEVVDLGREGPLRHR